MTRLIFVTGGARSGKSSFALGLAEGLGNRRLYLATAEAYDDEMTERIAHHREQRGSGWTTVEEPLAVSAVFRKAEAEHDVVLLECLTLWVSNMLLSESYDEESIMAAVEELLSVQKESRTTLIVVSNEVGMGLVPDNPLGRRFRDVAGRANQRIASEAEVMYFVVSGVPMKLK